MYHEVKKPFEGGGVQRLTGEAMDPAEWRNGRRLVEQRLLSPFPVEGEPADCKCGRKWFGTVPDHGCEEAVAAQKKQPAKAGA